MQSQLHDKCLFELLEWKQLTYSALVCLRYSAHIHLTFEFHAFVLAAALEPELTVGLCSTM